MSQHTHKKGSARQLTLIAAIAAVVVCAASSANAQWAAKPAPALPRTLLDQARSGSVVLALVFDNSGHVRDAQVVRSSGVSGLDDVARDGAKNWRLDPASVQPSDMTVGRRHMIKFYQNPSVSRRVEPIKAFWKER